MNLPPCPNFTEGRCPRSDVYVEREGDEFFTFRCRTCHCANVFPKDNSEKAGRYEAGLKREALKNEAIEAVKRKKAYSILRGD